MARSTWAGTLSIGLGVIPLKAYPYASASKRKGFKNVCPCHGKPIAQRNHCTETDKVVTDVGKAVELGKSFRVLKSEHLEAIGNRDRTDELVIEQVAPLDSVPIFLATGAYALVPDTGGESGASKLWQALRHANLALISRWVPRAGSKDAPLAIYGGAKGLVANTLPYGVELVDPPEPDLTGYTAAPAELALLQQALTTLYPNDRFEPRAFVSHADTRREEVISKLLDGQPVAAPTPDAAPAVPDLMAALEASLAAAQPKEPIAA